MQFPKCDETPLGIYPVVDSSSKLEPLYQCGITTAQLRVKNLSGKALEKEIIKAIEVSERYHVRLFINDYWQLAIRHHAYGVHLGQEDIQEADIAALYQAGVRLGISTHTPEEIEVAMGFSPSYLAIGPIYPPISKKLLYPPVGPTKLKAWAATLPYPIVAIGGITQENIADIVAVKAASGIAMISSVLDETGQISKEKTEALMRLYASGQTRTPTPK